VKDLPVVKGKKVFDITKSDLNDFFESRVYLPSVLLEDLINVITPSASDGKHKTVFFRNVFSESGTKSTAADCTGDPLAPHEITVNDCNATPTGNNDVYSSSDIVAPTIVAALIVGIVGLGLF
jgi:hypothetical protein